jgi:hypothetical protein
MITVGNYNQAAGAIDFSKMPASIQEGHKYMQEYGDLYSDDAEIKEAIDLYIEKLNSQAAKQPKAKAVKQPKAKTPCDCSDCDCNEKKAPKKNHITKGDEATEEEREPVPEPEKPEPEPKAEKPATEKPKKGDKESRSREQVKKEYEDARDKAEAEVKERFSKLTEKEVIAIGLAINEKRSIYSQIVDGGSDNSRRLSPTPENLLRWMKNPGKFDLIGVDTFRRTDATADYSKTISKQKIFNLYGIKI